MRHFKTNTFLWNAVLITKLVLTNHLLSANIALSFQLCSKSTLNFHFIPLWLYNCRLSYFRNLLAILVNHQHSDVVQYLIHWAAKFIHVAMIPGYQYFHCFRNNRGNKFLHFNSVLLEKNYDITFVLSRFIGDVVWNIKVHALNVLPPKSTWIFAAIVFRGVLNNIYVCICLMCVCKELFERHMQNMYDNYKCEYYHENVIYLASQLLHASLFPPFAVLWLFKSKIASARWA